MYVIQQNSNSTYILDKVSTHRISKGCHLEIRARKIIFLGGREFWKKQLQFTAIFVHKIHHYIIPGKFQRK
jgi:hypothetical protein